MLSLSDSIGGAVNTLLSFRGGGDTSDRPQSQGSPNVPLQDDTVTTGQQSSSTLSATAKKNRRRREKAKLSTKPKDEATSIDGNGQPLNSDHESNARMGDLQPETSSNMPDETIADPQEDQETSGDSDEEHQLSVADCEPSTSNYQLVKQSNQNSKPEPQSSTNNINSGASDVECESEVKQPPQSQEGYDPHAGEHEVRTRSEEVEDRARGGSEETPGGNVGQQQHSQHGSSPLTEQRQPERPPSHSTKQQLSPLAGRGRRRHSRGGERGSGTRGRGRSGRGVAPWQRPGTPSRELLESLPEESLKQKRNEEAHDTTAHVEEDITGSSTDQQLHHQKRQDTRTARYESKPPYAKPQTEEQSLASAPLSRAGHRKQNKMVAKMAGSSESTDLAAAKKEMTVNSTDKPKPTSQTIEDWKDQYNREKKRSTEFEDQYNREKKRSGEFEDQYDREKKRSTEFEDLTSDLQRRVRQEEERTKSEMKAQEAMLSQQTKLEEKYEALRAAYDKLNKAQEKEKRKAASESAEHAKEKESLRRKIDDLRVSHIKSVNNIGTGLEPVSHQTFRESFEALHHQIEGWCRKVFTSKSEVRALEVLDTNITEILSTRVRDISVLSVGRLMESIIWGYLEERILSVWFPAMSPRILQQLVTLEENIRCGDTSDTLERADFWRAYTSSLLFQSSKVRSRLDAVDIPTWELCKLLSKAQTDEPSIAESILSEHLQSVMVLAAQFKCQRGVFELDDSIHLGDRYDDERMADIQNPDLTGTEDAEFARVCGIVSNGMMWKSFTGERPAQERIFKARVLVTIDAGEGA